MWIREAEAQEEERPLREIRPQSIAEAGELANVVAVVVTSQDNGLGIVQVTMKFEDRAVTSLPDTRERT